MLKNLVAFKSRGLRESYEDEMTRDQSSASFANHGIAVMQQAPDEKWASSGQPGVIDVVGEVNF